MKNGAPKYLHCPRCLGQILMTDDSTKPICPACGSSDLVRMGGGMSDRGAPRKVFWTLVVVGLGVVAWLNFDKLRRLLSPPQTTQEVAAAKPQAEEVLPQAAPGFDVKPEQEPASGDNPGDSPPPPPRPRSQDSSSPGGVISPPAGQEDDKPDPKEVARLHRMVAEASLKMEAGRRALAEDLAKSGVGSNFKVTAVVANPAAAEKVFREALRLTQDKQKEGEAHATSLRSEIRRVSVGEPARNVGVNFFHAVTGEEDKVWTEAVAVCRDATSAVPVMSLLMRNASSRDAEGNPVFRKPSDQAAWKERVEAFSALAGRWRTLQEKLRAPAALPPTPAVP